MSQVIHLTLPENKDINVCHKQALIHIYRWPNVLEDVVNKNLDNS